MKSLCCVALCYTLLWYGAFCWYAYALFCWPHQFTFAEIVTPDHFGPMSCDALESGQYDPSAPSAPAIDLTQDDVIDSEDVQPPAEPLWQPVTYLFSRLPFRWEILTFFIAAVVRLVAISNTIVLQMRLLALFGCTGAAVDARI